jgi:DTW domain-containing protein
MPGRPTCYRCLRPQVSCVCHGLEPVDNHTRVVILQHHRERQHPFGTARLARLGLRRVDVHVALRDADGLTRCPPCAPVGAVLLYPGPHAQPIDALADSPPALVVLDGTWSTARKVRRDNTWLQALPCVSLTPARPSRYRIRKAPRPEVQLSTIEAIVQALAVLEPATVGLAGLLDVFEAMVERQIAIRDRHRRTG